MGPFILRTGRLIEDAQRAGVRPPSDATFSILLIEAVDCFSVLSVFCAMLAPLLFFREPAILLPFWN